MDCGAYRGVKLLEHAMKIVERVLENRVRGLVMIHDMQFGFMPRKGTTHALFILRRTQEEFPEREQKLYMCFVDLEKAFDRVPRKVMEWVLKKKGLAEVENSFEKSCFRVKQWFSTCGGTQGRFRWYATNFGISRRNEFKLLLNCCCKTALFSSL